MSRRLEARTLRTWIDRPPAEVYAFMADPTNMARWAAGIGAPPVQRDGRWFVDAPEGTAEVRFAPPNPFGVLDHTVVLADGTEVFVPLRVIANGDGAEVLFELQRLPGMTDAQHDADAAAVARDLATLKALLEGASGRP